jgi:hypothetical protein
MSEHEFVRAAQEALDYLGLAERPAESRQDGGVDPDGEALAVDEHPFGVEDHKPGLPHNYGPLACRAASFADRAGHYERLDRGGILAAGSEGCLGLLERVVPVMIACSRGGQRPGRSRPGRVFA